RRLDDDSDTLHLFLDVVAYPGPIDPLHSRTGVQAERKIPQTHQATAGQPLDVIIVLSLHILEPPAFMRRGSPEDDRHGLLCLEQAGFSLADGTRQPLKI